MDRQFLSKLIQNIGLSILQAKNLQGFRSIVLILIALINIAISIPLALKYEGIGVALGTGISYLLGNAIVMNIYYHRKIGINIPIFWKNISIMSIPIAISLVFGFILNTSIPQSTIPFILLKVLLFSVVYFVLLWFFGFNEYEKNLLSSLMKKIKHFSTKSNIKVEN